MTAPDTPASGVGTDRVRVDAARVRQVSAVIAGAVAVLGVIGFVVSFARVSAAAAPSFGALAPAVPMGIDVGILGCSPRPGSCWRMWRCRPDGCGWCRGR